MSEKMKNIIVSIVFIFIMFFFLLLHIIFPDADISKSERRYYTDFPKLNSETVSKKTFMDNFEKYMLDRFPFRNEFRSLKSYYSLYVMGQRDNNGVYRADGSFSSIEYPMNRDLLEDAAKKITAVQNASLNGMNVFYSIIPDKNYFLAEKNGFLSMDYNELVNIINTNISDSAEYIDIFSALSIDDYYTTDTHWKQENLRKVLECLSSAMGFSCPDLETYSKNEISEFYGVYFGQAAMMMAPDTIVYLENEATKNATVRVLSELNQPFKESIVYDLSRLDGLDKYELFLSGTQIIIDIKNPNASSDKTLYLFRDSFGSSLSPLLIESYSEIVLIDLRWIPNTMLGDYIEFKPGSDALFLYNTSLLNNSDSLKVVK